MSAPERIRRGVATRLGIALEEYDARRAAGELWCSGCRAWHDGSEFGGTRGYCRKNRREAHRARRLREKPRNWLIRSQAMKDRLARVLVK